MATLNLNILKCQVGYFTEQPTYIDVESPQIRTGSSSIQGSSLTTKISFQTPPFLSKQKVTIQLKAKIYNNLNGSVALALSKSNYTSISQVGSPFAYSQNWRAEELNSTLIASGEKSNKNGYVYFSIKEVELQPSTIYYLYFLRTGAPYITQIIDGKKVGGYDSPFWATEPELSLEVEKLIQLDAPEITTDTWQVLPYNGKLTVTWKPVRSTSNNPLKGYRVFLWEDTSENNSAKITADTINTSYTFSLKNIPRKKVIVVGVVAISEYEKYLKDYPDYLKICNSNYSRITAGRINSLPVISGITTNGDSIAGNRTITFTINASDENNQELSYYYSLNNSPKKSFSGNKLSISLNFLKDAGITKTGNYTINFYVYDGMEYSSASSKIFKAEFAPIISSRSAVATYITDGLGNNSKYVKTVTLKFVLENNITSGLTAIVKAKVKVNNEYREIEISSGCYKLDLLKPEKTITVDITKVSTEIIPYKSSFALTYEVVNSVGLSSGNGNWESSYYNRPNKLAVKDMPSVSITNDAKTNNDKWLYNFKQSLNFNFTTPMAKEGLPAIARIDIIAINNQISKKYYVGNKAGNNYINKFDFSDFVVPTETINFKIQIKDVAGQITEKQIDGNYTRIAPPIFNSKGTNQVIPAKLNPHTYNGSFSIQHIIAMNTANPNIDVNYSYSCAVSGKAFSFKVSDNKSTDNNNISIIAENISNFNNSIKNIIGKTANFEGTAQIVVTATDAFGQVATLSISFKINSITSPSFEVNTFELWHDYDISNTLEKIVQVNNNILATRIFNPGEGIIFKIPVPKDPNEDVSSFKIYLYRKKLPLNKSDIPNYNDITNAFDTTPWVTVPVKELGEPENNYYFYKHTASTYKENEFFYFKIVAVDSRGNESRDYSTKNSDAYNGYKAIYSQVYIIGARVAPSQIEVVPKETHIYEDTSAEEASVNVDFSLTVNDFGGSATTNDEGIVKWEQEYYDNYPNLERYIDENIKWDKKILVEVSPTIDFSGEVLKQELNYGTTSTTFSGYPKNSIRVYVRITLIIPYTLENGKYKYILSAPVVYSYFSDAPTVAHRFHRVGINVKEVDNESVLIIDGYENYKKIKLRSSTSSIEINLENSTISGLTIDCGTWSEI